MQQRAAVPTQTWVNSGFGPRFDNKAPSALPDRPQPRAQPGPRPPSPGWHPEPRPLPAATAAPAPAASPQRAAGVRGCLGGGGGRDPKRPLSAPGEAPKHSKRRKPAAPLPRARRDTPGPARRNPGAAALRRR